MIQPDGVERCVCDTIRHYCGPKEDSCVKYECTGNKILHLNCMCTCPKNYIENSEGDCIKFNIIRCRDGDPNRQCGQQRIGVTTKITTTRPTEYQPSPPEMNVTNITSSSATLVIHVNGPEDKNGFVDVHIYKSQNKSLLREQVKHLDPDNDFTELEVSNLAPNTAYTVAARLFLQNARPSVTSELRIRTVPENVLQESPPEMKVTNITSTSATLVIHVIGPEDKIGFVVVHIYKSQNKSLLREQVKNLEYRPGPPEMNVTNITSTSATIVIYVIGPEDKNGFVAVHIYKSQNKSLLREQVKNLDPASDFTELEVSNLAPNTAYTVAAIVFLQNARPSVTSELRIRTVPENDEEEKTATEGEAPVTPSTEFVWIIIVLVTAVAILVIVAGIIFIRRKKKKKGNYSTVGQGSTEWGVGKDCSDPTNIVDSGVYLETFSPAGPIPCSSSDSKSDIDGGNPSTAITKF
ncbi:uncharacterized protein [Argopecten irradians]